MKPLQQDSKTHTKARYPYPFDDFYSSRDYPPFLVSATQFEPSSNYETSERGQKLLRAAENTIAPLLERLNDSSMSACSSLCADINDSDAARMRDLVNNAIKDLDSIPQDLMSDSSRPEVKRKLGKTPFASSSYSVDPEESDEGNGGYQQPASSSAYENMHQARKQVLEASEDAQNVAVSLRSLELKSSRKHLLPCDAGLVSGVRCDRECAERQDPHPTRNSPVSSLTDVSNDSAVILLTHRRDYKQNTTTRTSRNMSRKMENKSPKHFGTDRVLDSSTQKNMNKSNVVQMQVSGRNSNTGIFVVKTSKSPPISEEENRRRKLVIQDTPLLVIPRECSIQRGYHIDYPPGSHQCRRNNVMVSEMVYDRQVRDREQRCSQHCDCNSRKDAVKVSGSAPFLFDFNRARCETKSRHQKNNVGFYSFLEQKDKPAQPLRGSCSLAETCQNNGQNSYHRTPQDGLEDQVYSGDGSGYKDTFERHEYRKTEIQVHGKSPNDYYYLDSDSGRDQPNFETILSNVKLPNTPIQVNMVTVEGDTSESRADSDQDFLTPAREPKRGGSDEVSYVCTASCAGSSKGLNVDNTMQNNVEFLYSKIETLEERSNEQTTRVTEILNYLSTNMDQESPPAHQLVEREEGLAGDNASYNESDDIQRDVPDVGTTDFPDAGWTNTAVPEDSRKNAMKCWQVQGDSKKQSGKTRSSGRHQTTKVSSPGRQAQRKISPSRPEERKVSPGRQVNRKVSPNRPDLRKVSPGRQVNRKVSPNRPDLRKVSPGRQVNRKVSPNRSDLRKVSPGRQVNRMVSPNRPDFRKVSPGRQVNRKVSPNRSDLRKVSPGRQVNRKVSPNRPDLSKVSPGRQAQRKISPCREECRNSSTCRDRSTCRTGPRKTSQARKHPTQITKSKPGNVKSVNRLARKKVSSLRVIAKSKSKKLTNKIKCIITSRDVVPVLKANSSGRVGTAALPKVVVGECLRQECKGQTKDTARGSSTSQDPSCDCPEPTLSSTCDASGKPIPRYQQRVLCRPVCHPPVRTTPQGNTALSCKPNCNLTGERVSKGHKTSVESNRKHGGKISKRPAKSHNVGKVRSQKTDQNEDCECDTIPEELTENEPPVSYTDGDRSAEPDAYPKIYVTSPDPSPAISMESGQEGNHTRHQDIGIQCDCHPLSYDSPKPQPRKLDKSVQCECHPLSNDSPKVIPRKIDMSVQCECHPLPNDSPKAQPRKIDTSVQCKMWEYLPNETPSRPSPVKRDTGIQCDCLPYSTDSLERTMPCNLTESRSPILKNIPIPVPAPRSTLDRNIECPCDPDVSSTCVESLRRSSSDRRSQISMCASQLASIVSELTYKNQLLNKKIDRMKESEERQREAEMKAALDSVSCTGIEEENPCADKCGNVEKPRATSKPATILPPTSKEDKERQRGKELKINSSKKLSTTKKGTGSDGTKASLLRNKHAGQSTAANTGNASLGKPYTNKEEEESEYSVSGDCSVEQLCTGYDDDPASHHRDDCACLDLSSEDCMAAVQDGASGDTLSTWSEGEVRSLGEIRCSQDELCDCPQDGVRSVGEVTDYVRGKNFSDPGGRSSGEIQSNGTPSDDACVCEALSAGEIPLLTNVSDLDSSKEMVSGSSSELGKIEIDLQIESR